MVSLLLTDRKIESIKHALERAKSKTGRPRVQTDYFDQYLRGALVLSASYGGAMAWRCHYRMHGKSNYIGLGRWPIYSLDQAREWAREQLQLVNKGLDPKDARKAQDAHKQEQAKTDEERLFSNVAKRFVAQKTADGLRSVKDMERVFEFYVNPTFGKRQIGSIRKSELTHLLRQIGDGECLGPDGVKRGGPRMADNVLTVISSMFRWYSPQDDSFVVPSFAGMRLTSTSERRRKRVLSDDEIRLIWPLLEHNDLGVTFGSILKVLLLSGQREREVGNMHRSEIDAHDAWRIPATRTKMKQELTIPLTPLMRAIIDKQERIEGSDLVFTSSGKPFVNFGYFKKKLPQPWRQRMP